MKSEFTLAFNEIAERSKLKREEIIDALENALVSAYRRSVNASTAQHVVAKVEPTTGAIVVWAEKEIVDAVQDVRTEVTLEEARLVDPEAALGGMVLVESTPKDFGRIAAQTAKQVLLQRVREAERESQYKEYAEREGDIVNGTVQSVSANAITIGLGRTEAVLPRSQQVNGERYRPHDKIRAYILEVRKTSRGPQIIVSRSHRDVLRRLLEYEVPEIYSGAVEVKSIAREAGHRSKVAVAAVQEGVDPVGACVGMRGVRIQSIVKELHDEKIDVIEWNPDQNTFIAKSLSPARVSGVHLDDDPVDGRTALVIVPDDQLSLAIGREGQNARLAAKLTGWRIDIKSLTEAARDAAGRLGADESLAELAARHAELLTQAQGILARKAENKPITPEEYQALNRLVDAVESARAEGRQAERDARAKHAAAVRATIPAAAYKMPLAEAGLPERVLAVLTEADFENAGQVLEKLALDEDRILRLEGMGPKVLEEIKEKLSSLAVVEPEAPVAVEAEAQPVPEAAAEVEAPAVEIESASEAVAEPVAEAPAELAPAAPAPEGEAGRDVGMEDIEAYLDVAAADEEEDLPGDKKKKKGKGKGKRVEMVFDEDLGVMVAKRKRKLGRTSVWDEATGVE
ncbi:MAG: transcription termination/antitermination protein NusA [Chloroflexi bacterium]|nr:transcription termination/antitermination protein NusA [Chloroflexota bacterium]